MKTFLSPLTPEQENECLKKLKKGSLEARNELTLHNMRLVAHVAKKYQNSEEDMEDLISIGTIGLMKAIATYKEDYGSRLATYAARCRVKYHYMNRSVWIKRETRSICLIL